MLVLSRKIQESVVVGGAGGLAPLLTVKVLEIRGSRVRLGFEVDAAVPVHRLEVWEQLCADDQPDSPVGDPAAPVA